MLRKTTALAIGAAGYVLGSRAGRGRYEQIKAQAEKIWGSPAVQDAASQAQDFAEQKAPVVKDKVAEVADVAASKASDIADKATSKAKDTASKAKETAGKASHHGSSSKDGNHGSATGFDGIDLVAAASTTPDDERHV